MTTRKTTFGEVKYIDTDDHNPCPICKKAMVGGFNMATLECQDYECYQCEVYTITTDDIDPKTDDNIVLYYCSKWQDDTAYTEKEFKKIVKKLKAFI
jgi:hypothetical protein